MHAATDGYDHCVEHLLEAGAGVEKYNNKKFKRALMMAAEGGHTKCVDLLLKAGASVEEETTSGKTALMLAASSGASDCVARLIQSGADVNMPEQGEMYPCFTPLIEASISGDLGSAKILIESRSQCES